MIQMNLKNKDSYRLKKQTYGCRRSGESQGKGIIREFEMDMYTLLYLKWITNKDPPYSIWNSAQCYVAAWMGGEFGREWIHVYLYGWVPLLFTWNCHNIVNRLYPNTKLKVNVQWHKLQKKAKRPILALVSGSNRLSQWCWDGYSDIKI